MLTPQKNREIVFHLLYSADFTPSETAELFPFLMEHHKISKKTLFHAQTEVSDLKLRLSDIDKLIQETAKDYEFDRIPKVEKNILRLGIYELCFSKEIPPKVAISEAIRLTRKFATAESAHFVNAILDTLYKRDLQ
ncbi:MAG TPA: transcription antitermination factor NusB [Rhabdochlamydiaceae bacterium]|nr:transcription antitermination factor NusB [Rhabdochlamydiaceae bacterium]